MLNVRLFIIQQIPRQFSSNSVKLNISRQSKFINKFINQHKTKGDPFDFSNSSIFGPTKKKVSSHVKRRVNVLNNIFMQHITDILSTGEIEPELLKRNIEISHVNVCPDFKLINVFWIDNDIDIKPDTPELLKKCSYRLRYELCQLHIVGKIPAIQFVKCRGVSEQREIEEKLKTLDFGEDFVPSPYPDVINHTVSVGTSTDTEEKLTKNKNLQDINDTFTVTLPEMRHNVFDLDHHRIMSKIKSELNKSHVTLKKQAIKRSSSTLLPRCDSQNEPDFLTSTEQKELFSKFLIQRRREERRLNKQKCGKEDIISTLSQGREEKEEEEEEEDDENYDYNDYNEDDTDAIHDIDNYYKDYVNRETVDKY